MCFCVHHRMHPLRIYFSSMMINAPPQRHKLAHVCIYTILSHGEHHKTDQYVCFEHVVGQMRTLLATSSA